MGNVEMFFFLSFAGKVKAGVQEELWKGKKEFDGEKSGRKACERGDKSRRDCELGICRRYLREEILDGQLGEC